MRVGLIGAGLLGSALAERFLAAGFAVKGFDPDADRRAALKAAGGLEAASALDAAGYGEIVVLCLPDSHVASSVVDGIAAHLQPETIVVDTTTGEPAEMEALSQRVAHYVDATIAGSSEQVRAGDAVVMAGGAEADVMACGALFASFARRTFRVGGCGNGARMKLVVNLVLGLNRAALAEGLAFAGATGVDLEMALEVLRSGPAFSTAMDRKGRKMLDRDWKPEARLRQHHKDVRLILAEATRNGLALPLSEAHDGLLERAEQAGFADADNSAVLEAYSWLRLGSKRSP